MDPLTVIVTALTAGAATGITDAAGQVVKDGYAALKALIVRKLCGKADVEAAIGSVESKPDSEPRKEVLKEELAAAKADQDGELVQQAQAFLDLLKKHGLVSGPSYQATVVGSGAVAQDHSVAAGAGGVAVGRDVHGGIHIGPPADKDTESSGAG